MCGTTATQNVTVTNKEGLHLRAATLFTALARRFESKIDIIKGDQKADGKSTPLQLTALGAFQGDVVTICASGRSDAQEAVDALVALFVANFEEVPE